MSLGGGGGSTTTVTSTATPVDPAAARRMAGVAESSDARAESQWKYYQDIFQPLDTAMAEANMALVGPQADLAKSQYAASQEILPQQAETTKRFYDETLGGVSKDKYVGEAKNAVEQAYARIPGQLSEQFAGLGISPSSGRFQSSLAGLGLDKAKSRAAAEFGAKRAAEAENYSRLAAGSGIPLTANANQGNYNLTSPLGSVGSFTGNTINANAAGMSPLTTSTSRGKSSNADPMYDIMGSVIGAGAGLGTAAILASSERHKTDVRPLREIDVSKLLELEPRIFKYKGTDTERDFIGLIAEEVANVVPELVVFNEMGQPDAIAYGMLPILLLRLVRDMAGEMEKLRGEVAILKGGQK